MEKHEISTHLIIFYEEIKKVINFCTFLSDSQHKFFDLVNTKFMQIDYILDNFLKYPLINNKHLKNLMKIYQNPRFFNKFKELITFSGEKKLKEIEKNLETQFTNLMSSIKPSKAKENQLNIKKTVFNQVKSKPSGSLKENQNPEKSLQKNNYTRNLIKKLKKNDFNIFDLKNHKNLKIVKKNLDLHKTKEFQSISALDSSTLKFDNYSFFSEKNKKFESNFDSLDKSHFESLNKNLVYTTPIKYYNLSENVQCEVEDTKIHDFLKKYDSKAVVSTPHNGWKGEWKKTVGLESPFKEKEIIRNLMKKEYRDIDCEHHIYHHSNIGEINEIKYIITASWWKKWIDYVKFESNDESPHLKDSFENSPIQDECSFNHPGKIINRDLLDPISLTERKEGHAQLILKENLLEHLDYEAIPKHIYSHLKKWYGSDFEIIRFMKNDPVHKDQVFLELYPEKNLYKKKFQFGEGRPVQTTRNIFKTNENSHEIDKNCQIF